MESEEDFEAEFGDCSVGESPENEEDLPDETTFKLKKSYFSKADYKDFALPDEIVNTAIEIAIKIVKDKQYKQRNKRSVVFISIWQASLSYGKQPDLKKFVEIARLKSPLKSLNDFSPLKTGVYINQIDLNIYSFIDKYFQFIQGPMKLPSNLYDEIVAFADTIKDRPEVSKFTRPNLAISIILHYMLTRQGVNNDQILNIWTQAGENIVRPVLQKVSIVVDSIDNQ